MAKKVTAASTDRAQAMKKALADIDRVENSEVTQAFRKLTRGHEIRLYRRLRKWTQGELANKSGVNKETIVRMERGENVRLDTMERVRTVLFGAEESEPGSKPQYGFTLSSEEMGLIQALRTMPRTAQVVAMKAVASIAGEGTAAGPMLAVEDPQAAHLLSQWKELDDVEKHAILLMVEGRVSAKAKHA